MATSNTGNGSSLTLEKDIVESSTDLGKRLIFSLILFLGGAEKSVAGLKLCSSILDPETAAVQLHLHPVAKSSDQMAWQFQKYFIYLDRIRKETQQPRGALEFSRQPYWHLPYPGGRTPDTVLLSSLERQVRVTLLSNFLTDVLRKTIQWQHIVAPTDFREYLSVTDTHVIRATTDYTHRFFAIREIVSNRSADELFEFTPHDLVLDLLSIADGRPDLIAARMKSYATRTTFRQLRSLRMIIDLLASKGGLDNSAMDLAAYIATDVTVSPEEQQQVLSDLIAGLGGNARLHPPQSLISP